MEVQKVVVNNQEYYLVDGKQIPKQFKWYVVLKALQEKYNMVYYWRINGKEIVSETLNQFSMDEENGIAPLMPSKVEVYEGNSLKAVIHNVKSLDPEVEESLSFFELI